MVRLFMKHERSDIRTPFWRKKVDSSLFNQGTTIPMWMCDIWALDKLFHNVNSRKDPRAQVTILFERKKYDGWVTVAIKGRKNPAYRLWLSDELIYRIKDTFLMSYMRDIESKLRKEKEVDIESKIPFWEFIDIEFDRYKKLFKFRAHYKQKASFPELFKRLVGSPALRKIDRELLGKDKEAIFRRDWKTKEDYPTELGAMNVIYMLLDTKNKYLYIG